MIQGFRSIVRAGAALAVAAACGLGGPAGASVVTTGCAAVATCTLQELVDGATIRIGDKLYEEWLIFDGFPSFSHVTPRFSGEAVPADLGLIVVEPVEVDPLRHLLRYDLGTQILAPAAEVSSEAFLPFGYVVRTIDGAPRIHDNVLELTAFELFGEDAGVQVAECANAGGFSIEDCTGNKLVGANNLGFGDDLIQSVIYDPPQAELFVFTSLAAQMFALGNGALLSGFTQEWSQVSRTAAEPASLALLGLGLAALVRARRLAAH